MRFRETILGAMGAIQSLAFLCGSAVAEQAWQPQEFPIGFWHGPPAAFNNLETWQTVRDCNFTFCGPARGLPVAENLKM